MPQMRNNQDPLWLRGVPVAMPTNLEPVDFYRREAARLRGMADSNQFGDVRDGLLNVARHYDVLADQAAAITRHTFGQRFSRPSLDPFCGAQTAGSGPGDD